MVHPDTGPLMVALSGPPARSVLTMLTGYEAVSANAHDAVGPHTKVMDAQRR